MNSSLDKLSNNDSSSINDNNINDKTKNVIDNNLNDKELYEIMMLLNYIDVDENLNSEINVSDISHFLAELLYVNSKFD